MADRYLDMDLTTGLNDGTSWANAWNNFSDFATNAASGDDVYTKGSQVNGGHTGYSIANGTVGNPIKIWGVKLATVAEPPVQSDLIPGLRTGDANPAYTQTGANLPPSLSGGPGGWRLNITKAVGLYLYGFKFEATWDTSIIGGVSGNNVNIIFEESILGINGTGKLMKFGEPDDLSTTAIKLITCDFLNDTAGFSFEKVNLEIFGGKISGAFKNGNFKCPTSANVKMVGVDLTALGTNAMFDLANCYGLVANINNCKVATGFVLTTGTLPGPGTEILAVGLSDNTGLTTSEQSFYHSNWGGRTVEETTLVRSGGASDGAAGAYSRKITLNSGETIKDVRSYDGPLMMGWIKGDGSTTKTITVYIYNATADLNDDDVVLRIFYPSGAGDALHEIKTTAAQLFGTPVAITDDTSTWNGSSAFSQKLVITLDGTPPIPDYEGPIYGRIEYYKASGPVLYYDPKIYIT